MTAIGNSQIAFNRPEKFENFKNDVLVPVIFEMSILKANDAESCAGSHTYRWHNRPVRIFNTRSFGARSLPTYGFNGPTTIFNFNSNNTTIVQNVHVRQKVEKEEERKKSEEGRNTALMIAAIGACVVGALYTGYQMAYSIKQALDGSKFINRTITAYKDVDFLVEDESIYEFEIDRIQTKNAIERVVNFRNEYLTQAYNRSFADVVEDVAIIAGLALIAYGAAMSFAAPLIAAGGIIIIASIISKLVTHAIWPKLEDDEEMKKKCARIKLVALQLMNLSIPDNSAPYAPNEDEDVDDKVTVAAPTLIVVVDHGQKVTYPVLDELTAVVKSDYHMLHEINIYD